MNIITIVLMSWALLLAQPAYADFTGKVVKVADGDTITVLHDSEQIKIRLAGIDAPEKAQPFGNVARQSMASARRFATTSVYGVGIPPCWRAPATSIQTMPPCQS